MVGAYKDIGEFGNSHDIKFQKTVAPKLAENKKRARNLDKTFLYYQWMSSILVKLKTFLKFH